MSKKTVVSVELRCSRCKRKVMKLIATVAGITSIVLDPDKSRVTVVGEADPVRIIKNVRKFRKSAALVSFGPSKEEKKDDKKEDKKEEKKEEKGKEEKRDVVSLTPNLCQRFDVWHDWYVTVDDGYNHCSIM